MKEMIAFAVLVVSVLSFGLTYQPTPVVIEKPVIVEKAIREECKPRGDPNWLKAEPEIDSIDELEETIKELEETLNKEEQ